MHSPYDCDYEHNCGYSIAFTLVILILLFIPLAWTFPLRDTTGRSNRAISILLAVFVFPLYIFIYAIQNPFIDREGIPRPCLTLLFAFFFWPLIFVLNEIPTATSEIPLAKPVDEV